jgi:hypothetical protein
MPITLLNLRDGIGALDCAHYKLSGKVLRIYYD